MNKGITLTLERHIQASPEAVWEALTNPGMVKQYFFGTDMVTTWKVGEPIFWRGEWEGVGYEDKGIVLEFEPLKRLKYKYWSSFSGIPDLPENYASISCAIREENGATILTVIQDGLENEEKRAHSEQNWLAVLEGMEGLLAAR